MYKVGGIIPSTPDPRDYKLSQVAKLEKPTTDSFEIAFNHPIYNQLNINGCGAVSLCQKADQHYEKTHGIYRQHSWGWMYGDRELYTGTGVSARELLNVARKDGLVFLEDFPYYSEVPDIINLVNANRQRLLPKAAENRIKLYGRINDMDEYKIALQSGFGVFQCIPICTSFMKTGSDGIVPIPDMENEELLGGHMSWDIGWKGEYKKFKNTWPGWGQNGIGYLPPGYPIWEMWFAVWEFDTNDSDEDEPVLIVIDGVETQTVVGLSSAHEYINKNIINLSTNPLFAGKPVKFIRCKDDTIMDQFFIEHPTQLDIDLIIEKNHIEARLSYKGAGIKNREIVFCFIDNSNYEPEVIKVTALTNEQGIAEVDHIVDNDQTYVTAGYIAPWRTNRAFASKELYYDKF